MLEESSNSELLVGTICSFDNSIRIQQHVSPGYKSDRFLLVG
jgi:hypothetical protein